MVIDNPIPPFGEWFAQAALLWLAIFGATALVVLLFTFLVSAARRGPVLGLASVVGMLRTGFGNVLGISPRRVGALAWLAVQESLRRRVWVALVVFLVVLAFAAWFLSDTPGGDLSRLYLSFVQFVATVLVWLVALFLSATSLPMDISRKTIFTVVTKPVRSSEIVLGRILGFCLVGTGLLAIMALVSYAFVTRSLVHTHQVENLVEAAGGQGILEGRTSLVMGHRHKVTIDPHTPVTLPAIGSAAKARVTQLLVHDGDEVRAGQVVAMIEGPSDAAMAVPALFGGRVSGLTVKEGDEAPVGATLITLDRGETDVVDGHWHEITPRDEAGKKVYVVGPPRDMLVARVPVYGQLRFLDRDGDASDEGLSVGDEWTYRQYIEGGSLAAAIWRFHGLTPERIPDGLRLNMTLGVFRTHIGELEKGIPGSLVLRNPRTQREYNVGIFTPTEFELYQLAVDRYPVVQGETLDLFQDLVADGELEVQIRCLPPGQYLGMAQADLYLLAGQAPFWRNYVKGYIGTWLQMVMIIAFGVLNSTFLNAAVSTLATLAEVGGGYFVPFIREVATGELPGGGPFASSIRMFKQSNVMDPLDPGVGSALAESLDKVAQSALQVLATLLPDLSTFSDANWVASGFDIPLDNLLVHAAATAAYVLPLFLLGFLILQQREVAQ